jgi:hypothetical protein
MKGTVRQRSPGSYNIVIYLGRDPMTKKKKMAHQHISRHETCTGLRPQSGYRWHVLAVVNGVEGPTSAETIASTRAAPTPCSTPGSCPINR